MSIFRIIQINILLGDIVVQDRTRYSYYNQQSKNKFIARTLGHLRWTLVLSGET